MTSLSSKPIVVGGGIAGLTSAIALQARGFTPTVIERRDRFSPAGAAVVLWPNGTKILRALGLGPILELAGCALREVVVHALDGEYLGTTDVAGLADDLGAPVCIIDRAVLRDILLASVGPDHVVFSQAITDVHQDGDCVVASDSDGNVFKGDFLVAADGVNSLVRKRFFGDARFNRAAVYDWMGITHGLADSMHIGSAAEFIGPGKRAGFLPLRGNKTYFRFTCALSSPPDDTKSHMSTLRDLFGDYIGIIGHYLDNIQEDEVFFTEEGDVNPLEKWNHDRVCLIGDAAHAMTPALGQGANQALEDAFVLAQCAHDALHAGKSISHALSSYSAQRITRANDIVVGSRKKTSLFWESRDALLRQWYDDMRNLSSKDAMKSLSDIIKGGPLA